MRQMERMEHCRSPEEKWTNALNKEKVVGWR